MSAVPPEAFSDRSEHCVSETDGFSRFSRLKFSRMLVGLRLRRAGQPLANTATARVAFSLSGQDRHAKVMISEFDNHACVYL
jgi:hypothetical protein